MLAITNEKGGAKTNLMGNLGAEFAASGKRVVLVDLDPHATLTTWIFGGTNGPGALRELFGHRQPIRTYRPDSTGAANYATVAAEVLQRAD